MNHFWYKALFICYCNAIIIGNAAAHDYAGCAEVQRYLSELNNDKILAYIERYRHIAISEMERAGVPASIKLAQGVLESGVGESELALKANNHFGIKCGGDWSGNTYYVWDDEPVKSCFRVYGSAEESYIAHTNFLTNPAKEFRYGFLFKLNKTDYKGWANGLQTAGYATSKTYAVKLISLIERFELYKIDHLRSNVLAVTDEEMASVFGDTDLYRPAPADTVIAIASITIPDPFHAGADVKVLSFTKEIFKLYGLETIFVQPDDNMETISKRYKVSPHKLSLFNELNGRPLKIGHYIFLQKKRKRFKGKETQHVVHLHETMHDIAQRYGIQLKTLLQLNKTYTQTEPKEGAIIRLK